MNYDPLGPPNSGTRPFQNDPPLYQAPRPLKLRWTEKFLIGIIGLRPSLLEKYGDESDLTTQCNRGSAELALLLYLFAIFTIALHTVFGEAGFVNPFHVLLAGGLTFLFQRIDAFLHVRGLYHAGKQDIIKGGAQLPAGAEDVAWYVAVAARAIVGIMAAIVLGAIAGQTLFAPEVTAQLAALSAEKNAAITAEHTATYDQGLRADRDAAKRAADEAASVRKNTEALRAQEVANVRAAARPSRMPQKASVETARVMTSATLQDYEAKSAAADKRAQEAAKAYEDKLAARGDAIRAMVEHDPRFINVARGLLARLKAIRTLAHEDGMVAAGIALVDLIGIGLELFVLVLFIAQAPTRLSVALYCEHLKSTSVAARDLVAAINKGPDDEPPSPTPAAPAQRGPAGSGGTTAEETRPASGFSASGLSVLPVRRGRGRPPGSRNKLNGSKGEDTDHD